MIFTITAQFLEQLILKYTIIAIEKTITLPFWIGNKIYNYYYQPQIKDIHKLRQEILQIQKDIDKITNYYCLQEIENNNSLL